MKPDTVWPNAPGSTHRSPRPQPNFAPADTLAAFAFANGMQLRGHTLLWHQTAPDLVLRRRSVGNPVNYRANVQQRLRDYIFAVVQHFPNVYAWDVVNEVATDTPNAANPYRTDSPWYIAYSVGGLRRQRVRARRVPVRQPGAHLDRPQQRQHEAHAERLQHRAARQTRQCHAHRAGRHQRRHSHRRRRPPVPPAAQRRCHPGHRGVHGGRRRCRARWSIT